MTMVVLSPLRKQGDVSRIPAAPPAVLLQGSDTFPTTTLSRTHGSSTSPTATLSRTQGSSTSPTATLACTQGSGTSLPDTLAHSYTPRCTPGPSPCIYKREVQGLPAPTHLGRGTQRQNSLVGPVEGPPGSETSTVGAPGKGLLRVNEQLLVEFQMGSLQQPLQPETVLRFGSL
jgi:hypothetical protein